MPNDWRNNSNDGIEAARIAIDRQALHRRTLTLLFCNLKPGLLLPRMWCTGSARIKDEGSRALDVRNQCSGYVYALA
jgi:3-oxoacyl-[acyl-carrier-protein] synthase III